MNQVQSKEMAGAERTRIAVEGIYEWNTDIMAVPGLLLRLPSYSIPFFPLSSASYIYPCSYLLPGFFSLTHADADSPTRIILVPSFAKTGVVVLVCLETLETKTVGFEAPGWKGEAIDQMNGQ